MSSPFHPHFHKLANIWMSSFVKMGRFDANVLLFCLGKI
jgi:hypothetical protein